MKRHNQRGMEHEEWWIPKNKSLYYAHKKAFDEANMQRVYPNLCIIIQCCQSATI